METVSQEDNVQNEQWDDLTDQRITVPFSSPLRIYPPPPLFLAAEDDRYKIS